MVEYLHDHCVCKLFYIPLLMSFLNIQLSKKKCSELNETNNFQNGFMFRYHMLKLIFFKSKDLHN